MCGIAGIFDPRQSPDWLKTNVERMALAVRHRGPDAGGSWVDGSAGIALGHRRLSILDLSDLGAQPMHSTSGRYVISYNGEVYNFRELRAELAAGGASFRGGSDTEVILAAVEQRGVEAALASLAGMYAIALWDRERQELHLVRDRMGIKPLYWAQHGSLFLFGSELKALLACAGWSPAVDRQALASYLRWNYVPAPLSIWQGVHKLPPATHLVVRADGTHTSRAYWSLRDIAREAAHRPAPAGSDDAAADKLEAALSDSVAAHMVSDVPIASFLSGGTDSSLVTALMQRASSRPVRTFSIGFREQEYDEAVYAKAVAAHLGTEHTELYVGAPDALAAIPNLAEHYDEPFADSSQVPTLLLSHLTRQHVTVALSGDGGDELFAGYTRYHWAEMVRRRFLFLPQPLRRTMAASIAAVPGGVWQAAAQAIPAKRRPTQIARRAARFATFLAADDADAVYRLQHSHWTRPEHVVRNGKELRGLPFDPALERDVPAFIPRMQLVDSLTYLPDDILTKVDRASMSASLEVRVPLLDHRVVEHAWRLPFHMKVRDGVDKWLLRQVLYRHVPKRLLDRRKMGFSIPVATWLRGPLRDWAEWLLGAERIDAAGYLNSGPIRAAWTSFLNGRTEHQDALWGVLMFEAWRERYLGASHTGAASEPQAHRPQRGAVA